MPKRKFDVAKKWQESARETQSNSKAHFKAGDKIPQGCVDKLELRRTCGSNISTFALPNSINSYGLYPRELLDNVYSPINYLHNSSISYLQQTGR